MDRRQLALCAGGGAVVAGLLWGLRGPRRGGETVRAPHARIPNTPLVTHDGTPVHFYDDLVKGKMVLITFMFTTCNGI